MNAELMKVAPNQGPDADSSETVSIHGQTCVISLFSFLYFLPCSSGSSALPNNMAYFGSSQEEEDLEEEDEEEEEEVRNGGGVHSHGGASSSQTPSSSSCHSTPRKGKIPSRQPLNGHGEDGSTALLSLTMLSRDFGFFLHPSYTGLGPFLGCLSWYNGPTCLCLLPEDKTMRRQSEQRRDPNKRHEGQECCLEVESE